MHVLVRSLETDTRSRFDRSPHSCWIRSSTDRTSGKSLDSLDDCSSIMSVMDTSMDLEVFESHRALLVAHAYRMLGDLARAEDIVQDAWLRWDGRQADVE